MTLYGLKMLLLTGDESMKDDLFFDMANVAREFIKSNENAIRPSLPPWGGPSCAGPRSSRKVYPAADPAVYNLHSIPTEGIFIVLPGRSIMSAHALAGAG